jgi:hypothetical protein
MDVLGGHADAAVLGHCLENFQLNQIHSHSPNVNDMLSIIQFPEN